MIGLAKRFWAFIRPTIRYWMETEVHVYCFSVAASVILSFYPFLIVMVSICKYVLHWEAAIDAIFAALADYLPGTLADFVERNLRYSVHPLEWVSILLLMFTANGVFEPLEVALNRAWGIKTNRSYVRNQAISFGLIFAVGTLTLLSATATAANQTLLSRIGIEGGLESMVGTLVLKAAAIPVSIFTLFLGQDMWGWYLRIVRGA